MSPLMIHSMLEQNKFIRYVQELPITNETKNTMMMVARIRTRLPENDYYNTTTFLSYIAHFNKDYSTENEASVKYANIRTSLDNIEEQKRENPQAKFGLTMYSDQTRNDFIAQKTCGDGFNAHYQKWNYFSRFVEKPLHLSDVTIRADDSIDWRSKGKVSSVKDQNRCGCCYAFAAVGAVESQHAIKTGKVIDLSVQQAVSCTYKDKKYGGNNGCKGGQSDGVFRYIIDNGGIASESSYKTVSPISLSIPKCEKKPSVAKISRQSKLTPMDENNLAKVVKTVGPVVTYIDADSLMNYKSGVVSTKSKRINHAVLTVGFTKDYWIIKNSWTPNWGEKGYFRLKRGVNALNMAQYNFAAYK
ncbi:unnamed protein product [Bursaphelenchus okinawaensis]|uniref:Peptidase C1A papain C-terminal domain-containing protein n=1 Tax=Bursaphelenchus okinawaensis TaxID=465554 RepID=A0A811L294_9BILA|nr:unnamed protein product [Bursaphelenchus okinawaensis]CAG9117355.1 unnamed protein product [Bursaphelenchus okinawaensis]